MAKRTLTAVVAKRTVNVEVRIYHPQPQSSGVDWECRYEIEWPGALHRNLVGGVDSVQAIFLAIQFIGAELYAGRPAALENLTWLEPGDGFGFLLPFNLRDLAIGEDKQL